MHFFFLEKNKYQNHKYQIACKLFMIIIPSFKKKELLMKYGTESKRILNMHINKGEIVLFNFGSPGH